MDITQRRRLVSRLDRLDRQLEQLERQVSLLIDLCDLSAQAVLAAPDPTEPAVAYLEARRRAG